MTDFACQINMTRYNVATAPCITAATRSEVSPQTVVIRASRRVSSVRPKVVVAVPIRKATWQDAPVEEVAHDPIRPRPVVAIDRGMMLAEFAIAVELEPA